MKQGKLLKILKNKGFYLSLLTGILAIAAICFVYFNIADRNKQNNVKDLNQSPKNLVQNQSTVQPSTPPADVKTNSGNVKKNTESADTKNAKTTKEKDSVAVVKQKDSKIKLSFGKDDELAWPVKGNVIIPYDVEHGVQFMTLGQYKTSNAIVISSKVGTDVKCSANAKVTNISKNEETGTTVSMEIGNGYTIKYGQLKNLKVKKGDTVKAGSVIGKVAKPTKYYVVEGPNVYMQVSQNDQTINPMYLLK